MKQQKPIIHGRDHLSGGADPVLPGFPAGDVADKILQAGPAAFWKLDETTGIIAHDSSGNGHDLTADASAGYTPPMWGQGAGPSGDTTAKWVDNTSRVSSPTGSPMGDFTDNFTAAVFVNVHTNPLFAGELIGQGTAAHSQPGWAIGAYGLGDATLEKFAVRVSTNALYADNPFTLDTWYFVAVVRDSGIWKLYVDGLLQAATITDSPGTGYGNNTWLGNDAYTFSGHTLCLQDALLSYAFIVDRAMSGEELLSITAGTDSTGLVLGIDDNGNVTWVQPKVEVTVNGETPDVTAHPMPPPLPPPDDTGPDAADWMEEQPFLWDGGEFTVPPHKWTTIPFTNPLMERQSNVAGGSTTWFELDWDDPAAAGWTDPATPRVITIPHDMPFGIGIHHWMQICLKLEIPPVEAEISVEGAVTRGSHRGLRVFETTHQKTLLVASNWRGAACQAGGGLDVFRDETAHSLTSDGEWFAWGDIAGEHTGEHGNIMIVPNLDYGFFLPGLDWLPGHMEDPPNPTLKKGMRLLAQVWHNASVPLTFDCHGVWPYRPHFAFRTQGLRSWGPPWSDWPPA